MAVNITYEKSALATFLDDLPQLILQYKQMEYGIERDRIEAQSKIISHQLSRQEESLDELSSAYRSKVNEYQKTTGETYQLPEEAQSGNAQDVAQSITVPYLKALKDEVQVVKDEKARYTQGLVDLNSRLNVLKTIDTYFSDGADYASGTGDPLRYDETDYTLAGFEEQNPDLAKDFISSNDWAQDYFSGQDAVKDKLIRAGNKELIALETAEVKLASQKATKKANELIVSKNQSNVSASKIDDNYNVLSSFAQDGYENLSATVASLAADYQAFKLNPDLEAQYLEQEEIIRLQQEQIGSDIYYALNGQDVDLLTPKGKKIALHEFDSIHNLMSDVFRDSNDAYAPGLQNYGLLLADIQSNYTQLVDMQNDSQYAGNPDDLQHAMNRVESVATKYFGVDISNNNLVNDLITRSANHHNLIIQGLVPGEGAITGEGGIAISSLFGITGEGGDDEEIKGLDISSEAKNDESAKKIIVPSSDKTIVPSSGKTWDEAMGTLRTLDPAWINELYGEDSESKQAALKAMNAKPQNIYRGYKHPLPDELLLEHMSYEDLLKLDDLASRPSLFPYAGKVRNRTVDKMMTEALKKRREQVATEGENKIIALQDSQRSDTLRQQADIVWSVFDQNPLGALKSIQHITSNQSFKQLDMADVLHQYVNSEYYMSNGERPLDDPDGLKNGLNDFLIEEFPGLESELFERP